MRKYPPTSFHFTYENTRSSQSLYVRVYREFTFTVPYGITRSCQLVADLFPITLPYEPTVICLWLPRDLVHDSPLIPTGGVNYFYSIPDEIAIFLCAAVLLWTYYTVQYPYTALELPPNFFLTFPEQIARFLCDSGFLRDISVWILSGFLREISVWIFCEWDGRVLWRVF